MKIQLVAPWHSMDEMPKLNKTFLFMCYTLDGNELCADSFYNDEKIDWPPPYWIEVEDMIEEKIVAHPFCWAYTSDLAAVEFNRMLVKETAQDAPSIRYVGAGGSGYGRTGSVFVGGSGSGGSSHGSSFSSVGGVDPGWGVGADLSQMRWPIGGIPGAYPEEATKEEKDPWDEYGL